MRAPATGLRRLLATLALALISACAGSPVSPAVQGAGGYEFVLVSESLRDEWASERMFWVDNERLVFRANTYVPRQSEPTSRNSLYLWNAETRQLRQLEALAGDICANDGFLSYIARRSEGLVYVEGPLDALTVRDLPDRRTPPRLRCRAVPPEQDQKGRIGMVGGGAFREITYPDRSRSYAFLPEGATEPVLLPMPTTHTGTDAMRYSEYSRSYIFLSTVFDREKKVTPFWQVHTDGRVETHAIPQGFTGGSGVPLPSAKGWLVTSAGRGVWLLNGEHLERVSPGRVLDIAVSPNGCRAAFKMHFDPGVQLRPYSVYTVRLC